MTEHCKNCNELISGNFCINCGQKKYKRIDRKYVFDEVQYTMLHTSKGLLYSIKNLLKNPGKTAREFIDGNRVNHYKPILLTFVLSGIATFLTYKVMGLGEIINDYYAEKKIGSKYTADMMGFFSNYTAILMILCIPFFAITTKIAFRKWGHNYYEHVVMNSYILSFYTLISIIFIYPIMFIFRHSQPGIFMTITQFSILLVPIMLIWFFKGFYNDKPLKSIIIKVFAIIGLVILGYILLIIVMGLILMLYGMIGGENAANYFKPK